MSDVAEAQEVAPEGSGESAPADWKAGLSEELQRDPSIAHIPDVETMAKSYVNAQRMVGADKIAIPGNHGTDEEWDQVYTKLGRPDAPEGYELEMNNVPDGMDANPELVGWFQQTAHKVGLTPKQAQTLADEYNVMAGQAEQSPDDAAIEAEAREQEGIRELQREYGKAFDNKVIGDMMRAKLGEDSIKAPKSDGSITPDDAQRELAKIEAPGGPYWDRNHPGHSAAVADALRLREFVHGDEEL